MSCVPKTQPKFSDVCELFEKLKKIPTKNVVSKKSLISELCTSYTPPQAKYLQLFSLLVPDAFFRGIRGPSKIFYATEIVGRTGDALDRLKKSKDISADASAVVKKLKKSSRSSLSIGDACEFVVDLHNPVKKKERHAVFKKMFDKADARDVFWMLRIMTRDLKIGTRSDVILDGIHSDALSLFRYQNQLRAVAQVLETEDTTPRMALTVPMQPMLPESCSLRALEKMRDFPKHWWFCEVKYDGESCVLIKRGDDSFFYSRNGVRMADSKTTGLIRAVSCAFPAFVDCILNGEIMRVQSDTNQRLPQCQLTQAIDGTHVVFVIYDLVLYKGNHGEHSWIYNKPLALRRRRLKSFYKNAGDGVVTLSAMKRVHSVAEVQSFYDRVVAEKHEGVVLKKETESYNPGIRQLLKIKFTVTVDLIVCAAFSDEDAEIYSYLLCAYDADADMFKTVVRMGARINKVSRQNLEEECLRNAAAAKPFKLSLRTKSLKPSMYFNIAHAPVVELRVASCCHSDKYTVTDSDDDYFTLNNPVFVAIRSDKNWQTADDVESLRAVVRSFNKAKARKKKAERKDTKSKSSSKKAKRKKKKTESSSEMQSMASMSSKASSRRPSAERIDDFLPTLIPKRSSHRRLAAVVSTQPTAKRRRTVASSDVTAVDSKRITPMADFCLRGEGSYWGFLGKHLPSLRKHSFCRLRVDGTSLPFSLIKRDTLELDFSPTDGGHSDDEEMDRVCAFFSPKLDVDESLRLEPCIENSEDVLCSKFATLLFDSTYN